MLTILVVLGSADHGNLPLYANAVHIPGATPEPAAGYSLLYDGANIDDTDGIVKGSLGKPGLLGLELALRHKPDLILLDVHLPDIVGAEVLARLKAKQRTRNIPVVVLSADATKSQINRLLTAGASDYLTKPLEVDRFVKVIEGHFREAALTATDGIGAGGFTEGLVRSDSPQQIADRILKRHFKGTDDALVLVVRYVGRGRE